VSDSEPSTAVADLASSSTAESVEPDVDVAPSTQNVVEAVDNNGNKLMEINEIRTSASSSTRIDGSGSDSYPLKSCNITLTPLKQRLKSWSSSSQKDSASLTASKRQESAATPLTQSTSQVTPLKSQSSNVMKSRSSSAQKSSKSPNLQKPSTPLKSLTPEKPLMTSKRSTPSKSPTPQKPSTPSVPVRSLTPSKSPKSSSRQLSLIEMFGRSAVPSSSSQSVDSTSSTEPPGDEAGHQESDKTSEHWRQSGIEILVEDSQMGPGSPVRMVDTQESMFVDDTPPHAGSSGPEDVPSIGANDDDDGLLLTAACDTVADNRDSFADTRNLIAGLLLTAACDTVADSRDSFADTRNLIAGTRGSIADSCASVADTCDDIAITQESIADARDSITEARDRLADICDAAAKTCDTIADRHAGSADTRDSIAYLRGRFANIRDTIADTCDNTADYSPSIAKTQDTIAYLRDRFANTRDNTADTRASIADTRDTIADSCDSASFSDAEVCEQTIIEVSPNKDMTSVSQVQATGIATVSDVGKVSANTVSKVSASQSQTADVGNEPATGSSVSLSTNAIDRTQHDAIDPTQHGVVDHTQFSSSDQAQLDVVDNTQSSAPDLSQRSVDHTQETVFDHTRFSSCDQAKLDVVDNTQSSALDLSQCSVHHTQETLFDHTRTKHAHHTQCDVPGDTATGENVIATDADDYISLSDSSSDDVPLAYRKASKYEYSSSETLSVRPRRKRRDRPLAGYLKSCVRKDAIHTPLKGRVTRPLLEMRQTRLNLRTRSVRRVADNLVTVGAKPVNRLPSQVTTGRPRGRPRRSENLSKPEAPKIAPHRLCRGSAKRSSRSVWMHVTSAELDIAPMQGKDLVETGCRGTETNDDVSGATGEQFANIEKCDAIDEVTELLVTVGAKHVNRLPSRVATGRPRGRPKRSELSKPELSLTTRQIRQLVKTGCRVTETDVDVSGATGKKNGDGDMSLASNIEKCDAIDEVTELPPDFEKGRTGEVPDKGIEVDEGSSVVEKPPQDDDREVVDFNTGVEPTADVDVLPPECCGKPDSGTMEVTSGDKMMEQSVVHEASSAVQKPQDDDGEVVDLNTGDEPSAGVDVLPTVPCGKPDSGIIQITSADKVVEPSVEIISQEQSSGRLSTSIAGSEDIVALNTDVLSLEYCGKPESGTSDVIKPSFEMSKQEQSSGRLSTSVAGTEDNVAETHIKKSSLPSEVVADAAAAPISVSNSADDGGVTDIDIGSSTMGDDNTMEVSETPMQVKKSTPEAAGEYQWKVPTTSSVTRGPATTPAEAPPETPTSIPRRRFTSRGSMMLERAKQLRRSAGTSPPGKSAGKTSSTLEQSCEDGTSERSPGSAVRHSGSGLSRLRVFSPAASPSASILRKRQLSTDSATSSSGRSPSSPSSRVSCLYYSTAV